MESNAMLLNQARDLMHKMIVLDLTARTLEVDKGKLNVLKVHRPITAWYDKQITEIVNELKDLNQQFFKLGGKFDLKAKNDEDVQVYTLLLRGSTYEHRYMNIVLRNHVEKELNKRLGLPYISDPYAND